jgi:flavodoxin
MKTISLFYNSRFGNGEVVCGYLSKVLNDQGYKAKCFSMASTDPKKIADADLYIFSSSTHFGNAPFKTKKFLNRIRIHHGNYALVTTNLSVKDTKTLKTMEDILNGKGLSEIITPLPLIVKTMKGPLEKTYKNKIETFVSKLKTAKEYPKSEK